jgi:hypothetical protein
MAFLQAHSDTRRTSAVERPAEDVIVKDTGKGNYDSEAARKAIADMLVNEALLKHVLGGAEQQGLPENAKLLGKANAVSSHTSDTLSKAMDSHNAFEMLKMQRNGMHQEEYWNYVTLQMCEDLIKSTARLEGDIKKYMRQAEMAGNYDAMQLLRRAKINNEKTMAGVQRMETGSMAIEKSCEGGYTGHGTYQYLQHLSSSIMKKCKAVQERQLSMIQGQPKLQKGRFQKMQKAQNTGDGGLKGGNKAGLKRGNEQFLEISELDTILHEFLMNERKLQKQINKALHSKVASNRLAFSYLARALKVSQQTEEVMKDAAINSMYFVWGNIPQSQQEFMEMITMSRHKIASTGQQLRQSLSKFGAKVIKGMVHSGAGFCQQGIADNLDKLSAAADQDPSNETVKQLLQTNEKINALLAKVRENQDLITAAAARASFRK